MELYDLQSLVESDASRQEILTAIKRIQAESIDVKWSIDDIVGLGKPDGKEIGRSDAIEIARLAEKHHDAQYGVTWDYLRQIIENYYNDKPDEDSE